MVCRLGLRNLNRRSLCFSISVAFLIGFQSDQSVHLSGADAATVVHSTKPLIISSDKLMRHRTTSYAHPECPERIQGSLEILNEMLNANLIRLEKPSGEVSEDRLQLASSIISRVHDNEYIRDVKIRCEKGAKNISPWDADTYISKHSFEQCLHAHSAWIDAVDEAMIHKNMAFAVVRPPGHHSSRSQSMGFCIFNFAVGAATYAMETQGAKRVGILDFDVVRDSIVIMCSCSVIKLYLVIQFESILL